LVSYPFFLLAYDLLVALMDRDIVFALLLALKGFLFHYHSGGFLFLLALRFLMLLLLVLLLLLLLLLLLYLNSYHIGLDLNLCGLARTCYPLKWFLQL
jgi:hypothetical protein